MQRQELQRQHRQQQLQPQQQQQADLNIMGLSSLQMHARPAVAASSAGLSSGGSTNGLSLDRSVKGVHASREDDGWGDEFGGSVASLDMRQKQSVTRVAAAPPGSSVGTSPAKTATASPSIIPAPPTGSRRIQHHQLLLGNGNAQSSDLMMPARGGSASTNYSPSTRSRMTETATAASRRTAGNGSVSTPATAGGIVSSVPGRNTSTGTAAPTPAAAPEPDGGEKGSSAPEAGQHGWRPRQQRNLTRREELERTSKALLNKLTVEKFHVITEKLARVVEDSLHASSEVQIIVNCVLEKAVTEPDWSEMYADVCQVLQWRSVSVDGNENIRKTHFMMALLDKIQGEYQSMPKHLAKGSTEQLSFQEQHQMKKIQKRILGVVKLIGELYQRSLLGFWIVRDVVVDLVISSDEPHEHFIECFLQLISTIGYFIDQNPKNKCVLDSWFGRLMELQKKTCYSKRLKCVIQDTIDMRRAQWRKKIHRETAKALSDLRDQLEKEECLGGAVHAAQYGNIVVVGERTNLNGQYLGYLKEQEAMYDRKVARRLANANAPQSAPGQPGLGALRR